MQLEANGLDAKGLQQIECTVVRLKGEGLDDLLQGAVAQLELSVSVGLPLPKRHKWVAIATIYSLTAQESAAIVPKPKGDISVQGAHLCPSLNLKRKQYQLNKFTTVVLMDVQRDLQPPKWPYGLMCAGPSGHNIILSQLFPYFFQH